MNPAAIAIAALALAVSGSAFAAPDAPAAVAAPPATPATVQPVVVPAAPKSRDDQIICQTTQVTGTRLGGVKVCKSRRAWAQESDEAGTTLSGMQATASHLSR
jgi:hypothetical protein